MARTVRSGHAEVAKPSEADRSNSNTAPKEQVGDTLALAAFTGDLANVDWASLSFDTSAGRGSFTSELLRGLRSKDPLQRTSCADSLSALPKGALEDHTYVPASANPSLEQRIKEAAKAVIEQASHPFPKIRTTH